MRYAVTILAMLCVCVFLVAMCGCASTPAVHAVCLPLKTYTADQERALGAALAAVPAGSPLVWAMADYGQMRAADRACLSAR